MASYHPYGFCNKNRDMAFRSYPGLYYPIVFASIAVESLKAFGVCNFVCFDVLNK